NHVVDYLHETAVHVVALGAAVRADPHFAVAQPSDHWATQRGDADLAVEQRQSHELGHFVEQGRFRRDHDQAELLAIGVRMVGVLFGHGSGDWWLAVDRRAGSVSPPAALPNDLGFLIDVASSSRVSSEPAG